MKKCHNDTKLGDRLVRTISLLFLCQIFLQKVSIVVVVVVVVEVDVDAVVVASIV